MERVWCVCACLDGAVSECASGRVCECLRVRRRRATGSQGVMVGVGPIGWEGQGQACWRPGRERRGQRCSAPPDGTKNGGGWCSAPGGATGRPPESHCTTIRARPFPETPPPQTATGCARSCRSMGRVARTLHD
eukprot:scaffold25960_cov53-Phaeocystis_antarctica.AAC.2